MAQATQRVVTIGVASMEEVQDRLAAAFDGKAQGSRISFRTPQLLWNILNEKRWDIVRAMAGQGPMAIREVARRVGRDVKAVHADIHALINAGIIDRTDGRVEFPYERIRVDFEIGPASDAAA